MGMDMFHDFINNRYGRIDRSTVTEFPAGRYLTRGIALKIALSGIEDYTFNGMQRGIKPGEALLMDEGVPFETYAHYASPQVGMCIDIPRDTLRNAYREFAPLAPQQPLEFPQGFYALQGYSLAPQLSQFQAIVDSLDWAQGHEQIFMMARYIAGFIYRLRNERAKLPVTKASTASHLFDRLQIARSYLHDTFRAPFSLGEVASAAALSEYHLARLFKHCFGTTVFGYHESLKMAYAREQLLLQRQSIFDLSLSLGYEDSSYFIRRFKKHFGVTPGKYAG